MDKITTLIETNEFKLFWKVLEMIIASSLIWLFIQTNENKIDITILKFKSENVANIQQEIKNLNEQLKSQNDLLIELKTKFESKNKE